MQRRQFLSGSLAAAMLLAVPFRTRASEARIALTESNLIYLSPVKSSGELSSCQAEVWYAMLGPDIYVCTAADSWRARAARLGVNSTKIWVGDLGVWRRADYQSLPSVMATAGVETDQAKITAVLAQFGRKYATEWPTWGPRFKNGLADGSRTMLRYELTG